MKEVKTGFYEDEDVQQKVPEDSTYGWLNFLMVFIGMWTALVAVGSGMDLGQQITPWKGALGIFLGYMICMVYGYLVGRVGVKQRLATFPLLARPFSNFWAFLPSTFSFLIGSVFIGSQADAVVRIIMEVLNLEIVPVLGPITNRAIISVILCSFMMYTAYRGIKYIKNISWISMPLYLSALIITTILVVRASGSSLGEILAISQSQVDFSAAVFMGVSLYAGFTGFLPDISRFVKNTKEFGKAIVVGYIIASLVPILGVIMGATAQVDYWVIFAMFGLGWGIYCSISMFLAQWTTNDNNAFTAGIALSSALRNINSKFKKCPTPTRSKATIIPIAIGIILAGLGAGATSTILAAVGALGSWLPSMSGVFIGHYYIVERGSDKPIYTKGIAGLLSWVIISVLVHTGTLPWGAITGVLGAFVLYIVFYYLIELPIFGKKESN